MKLTSYIYKTFTIVWIFIPFKKLIVKIVRFFIPSLKIYYRELWFKGKFKVLIDKKYFKLYADKGENSILSLFWFPLNQSWDAKSIFIWADLAKISESIIDVGANMGLYAIAAKTINNKAKVFAIEPSNNAFKSLCKNIKINNLDIKVSQIAISNKSGLMKFYDLKKPTAIASLKPNANLLKNENLITYNIPVMTLDTFKENNLIEKIDLISIDVEKNEPEVLQGMKDIIEKDEPAVLIEVLSDEIGNNIETYFSKSKYLYFLIDEQKGVIKTERIKLIGTESRLKGSNFLICTEAKAIKIGLLKS